MIRSYFTIAFRNLFRNKVYGFLNILGISVGLTVALLIGLWVWDELSFNYYHQQHSRIGEVVSIETFGGTTTREEFSSVPIAEGLRNKYPQDFKKVALTSEMNAVLSVSVKKISAYGFWAEESFPSILGLKMISGSQGFQNPSSILINESLAKSLFADEDPIGRSIQLNTDLLLTVGGVYEDIPGNSRFFNLQYLLPWKNAKNPGLSHSDDWLDHHFQVYVELNDEHAFQQISSRIKEFTKPLIQGSWEELMIFPMDRWHLYTPEENGEGRIHNVRLFGSIGFIVLLLACINFMNLSTARSEKRAREIGIRKTMGSSRFQLVLQFLGESVLLVFIAMILSLLMVWLAMPLFNLLAGKTLALPFLNFPFWICLLGITLFTGLLAGSYPAFFLSGFNPVRVLKGNFKTGKYSAIPRRILVVLQFTVCIALVTGTIVVYRQIQYAKSRPNGYSIQRLITMEMKTEALRGHYDALRNDLLKTGVVENMSESSSPATEVRNAMLNFEWKGKDPAAINALGTLFVTYDFGSTVQWQILSGRDFSRNYSTDSNSIILNEAAVAYTHLKNPIGESIRWRDIDHPIIGVVKNMVMQSPYSPVEPVFFVLKERKNNFITIRIDKSVKTEFAIPKIEKVFKQYDPELPFDYQFTADVYNRKFEGEEYTGNLSSIFGVLAIFISCLGLFGLASYVAEQRTRELAIRKVLGADVFNLWRLLSSEFLVLIVLSSLIAVPLAWWVLHRWLEQFEYRTSISFWIFAIVALLTLMIGLLTVSFQIIRAALLNPAKLLRSE